MKRNSSFQLQIANFQTQTTFPPLSTPAFSRPAGREKELTAMCGQHLFGRTYHAAAN